HAGRIRLSSEDVLIGATNDLFEVPAGALPGPVAVAATLEIVVADADRRDEVIPALVSQVPNIATEAGRITLESRISEHDHLGAAKNSDRRDAVVHVARHLAKIFAHADTEVLAPKAGILVETGAVSRNRS